VYNRFHPSYHFLSLSFTQQITNGVIVKNKFTGDKVAHVHRAETSSDRESTLDLREHNG